MFLDVYKPNALLVVQTTVSKHGRDDCRSTLLCKSRPAIKQLTALIPYLDFTYFINVDRLIKHTGRLLEEQQEKLCIKVLQTLKEMMSFEMELGMKVQYFHVSMQRVASLMA